MQRQTSPSAKRHAAQTGFVFAAEQLPSEPSSPTGLKRRTRLMPMNGQAACGGKNPTTPFCGPEHPHFYHRDFGNHAPLTLDVIPANPESVQSILQSLPKSREARFTRVEHLHADERKGLDAVRKGYEELVRQAQGDNEDTRAAALAKGFREVSRRLGRAAFLYGMLRRMVENEQQCR